MPLYEYYCPTCPQKFELLRAMTLAEEPVTCPSGHPSANRIVSLFASFAKGEDGTVSAVGGSGGCAACAGGACATCGSH
jgi:putative FmdB family regulatory protein